MSGPATESMSVAGLARVRQAGPLEPGRGPLRDAL